MRKPLFLFLAVSSVLPAADKVRISETAGLAREQEPVIAAIAGKQRVLFVTIGANQSKVVDTGSLQPKERLRRKQTDPVGFQIENSAYWADLSKRMVAGKEEDSGTLRGLLFKRFGVLLERTQNRMHWAPSFQRTGARGYTSIAMWTPVQKVERTEAPGAFTFTREGFHASYPEIALWAEYRFFAHVPYFLFRSTMTITSPIEIFWLRNQEMTMDDLFTHVAWPGPGARPVLTGFEGRKKLLENQTLPADVPWVAFLNLDKGYGFGAVALAYHASKTAHAITSINDGAANGKYWDRRIIDQTPVMLAPGDRFEEHTAFVLFQAPPSAPLAEFLTWEKKLRHPVRVEPLKD